MRHDGGEGLGKGLVSTVAVASCWQCHDEGSIQTAEIIQAWSQSLDRLLTHITTWTLNKLASVNNVSTQPLSCLPWCETIDNSAHDGKCLQFKEIGGRNILNWVLNFVWGKSNGQDPFHLSCETIPILISKHISCKIWGLGDASCPVLELWAYDQLCVLMW